MRAIDTNVLVRILTTDDPAQCAAAQAFVAPGALVILLALAEAMWALSSVYGRPAAQIATAAEMLLKRESLVLQFPEAVAAAAETLHRRPSLGFTDCLMLHRAQAAGHSPLGTFDRALASEPGAVRLSS